MPDPAVLSDLGNGMLAQLPPPLRGSYDYMAIINSVSKEFALLEASIEVVRAQFNPATADVLLDAWEYQLKLPVGGGADSSTDSRRQAVIARLRKVLNDGSGREWENSVSQIVGPGWAYREHDPADGTSPAAGVIEITVPFASGTSRFIDAQLQIRELTDAHLQIVMVSSSAFQLDQSELDVSEFGG
jgi:hypothetical protein